MNNFSKIIIAVLVVLIIALAGYMVGNYVLNNGNGKTIDNKVINKVINNAIDEIKNSINNEILTNEIIDNEIKNEVIANETIETVETIKPQTQKDERQAAIDMARNEWGEDDSVTFKIDEQNEKGEFIIQVVDKNTTNVVLEYYVDVSKNTIKQK